MSSDFKKIHWFKFITIFVIVALTGEVVLLIKQNREMRAMIGAQARGFTQTLKTGERVSACNVLAMDGTMSELHFTGSPKKWILFVLSTGCPHCERDLPLWNHLVQSHAGTDCTFLGVSVDGLEDTKKFLAAHEVQFNLTAAADREFEESYKIAGVPQTILLDGNGVVEKVWAGELSPDVGDEIQHMISTSAAQSN